MDETPPDGSAGTLAQTAATLQPLTTPGVVFVLLACGSFPGSMFLLGLLAWATYRVTADARPASRSLLRGSLLAALTSLPLAVVLPEALPQVFASWAAVASVLSALVGVWALFWGSLWWFTRHRITDRAVRRSLDNGFLPTALVLLFATVLPWTSPSPDAIGAMLMVSAGASMLLAGRAVRATRALWPLTETRPIDFHNAVEARLHTDFGLETDGTALVGIVSGIHTTVHVDTAPVPAVTTIRTTLGATPAALHIRARRPKEIGGQAGADPLLGQLLFIEGLSDPAMLGGLHEALLSVLHGWPDSALENGQLTVRIPGPPFDAARLGEAPIPDQAGALAEFVARRVGEAVALAQALHARGCAEDVARPYQALRTPERG